MKLRDLEATFLKLVTKPYVAHHYVDALAGSDGVMFLCPLCFAKNGGRVGSHMVICWWTGVDATHSPGPGRWNPSGTGLDDLTFVPPGAVSVQLHGGCAWHGFVKNGDAA